MLSLLHHLRLIVRTIGQTLGVFVQRRQTVLIPLFLMLLGLVALILVAKSLSPIAPFVYSVF